MALVYKITNTQTYKSYIGYTSLSAEARWKQHSNRAINHKHSAKFDNAIRKYGTSVWVIEVLEENLSVEQSKATEQSYISLFDTYNTGYNSTLGGDGNNGIVMSEASNSKRRIALKGKKKNYNRMHGKTHSEESKAKISNAHKGMKKPWVKWSSEQIAKRAFTRRTLTLEQYQQIQTLKAIGFTNKNIAAQLNVSVDVVKKWSNRKWELV